MKGSPSSRNQNGLDLDQSNANPHVFIVLHVPDWFFPSGKDGRCICEDEHMEVPQGHSDG
jgi:hypothetical protein